MKEKILDTLKSLGFTLEDIGDSCYGFQFEGNNYLYMYNESDEDFLNIALPVVLEWDGETKTSFYQLMDKLNSTLKYVKANKVKDSMWLYYERELFGDEDLELVVSRMIFHLDAGINYLHRSMKKAKEMDDSVQEGGNDDEAIEITDNEDVA